MSNFHKHHRKMRSHGGTGFWGNMIEIPTEVHDLVHANPEVAYRHGMLVKSHDDPNQIRPDVRGFLSSLGYEGEVIKKPKRKRLKGDAKAKRKSISVRLPEGVDGAYWDDLLAEASETELAQPDTQFDKTLDTIATGKLLVAVLERFTGRV